MKRKIVASIIAGVMLLSTAGCSSASNQNAGGTTAAESGAEQSTTSDASSGSEQQKIKLVAPVTGYNDDQIAAVEAKGEGDIPNTKYYRTVRSNIEAKYPEYEVEYVDWGWAESLDQKQRSMIAAGDVPNIVGGEVFMPTYANEGILEPLPQDIVDRVHPSFLINDREGKPVAVAHKSSIFMLFWNKDILEKAGFDPEKPPTTWDEFKSMSDAITAAGNGEYWGGGIPSFPHAGGSLRATPFFRQMGTDFGDGTNVSLSDPKLRETLQFIRDMNKNFPPGLGNSSDEDPLWNAFQKSQTIAFAVNGAWQASGSTREGMNWGVAPLPLPTGGKSGNCLVGATYQAVPKASNNIEASFNLIRESLDEEVQKIWLEDSVCVPLKTIIDDKSLYEGNMALEVAMDVIQSGVFSGLASFPKNDSQVWEILNAKVLARTTMTEDSIDTICDDAQREIDPLLQ